MLKANIIGTLESWPERFSLKCNFVFPDKRCSTRPLCRKSCPLSVYQSLKLFACSFWKFQPSNIYLYLVFRKNDNCLSSMWVPLNHAELKLPWKYHQIECTYSKYKNPTCGSYKNVCTLISIPIHNNTASWETILVFTYAVFITNFEVPKCTYRQNIIWHRHNRNM